jgi:hypothetical protein
VENIISNQPVYSSPLKLPGVEVFIAPGASFLFLWQAAEAEGRRCLADPRPPTWEARLRAASPGCRRHHPKNSTWALRKTTIQS